MPEEEEDKHPKLADIMKESLQLKERGQFDSIRPQVCHSLTN